MIRRSQPASTHRSTKTSGVSTMRCASNGTDVCGRQAATTSGPTVRFGTNCPSMMSHWIRSTPAFSRAAHSSPRRAKSAGRTDGAIWVGRPAIARTLPGHGRERLDLARVEILVDATDLAVFDLDHQAGRHLDLASDLG